MRITPSMLSEASLQAGMSMTGNSLVNFLNDDASDSLISSLGEKNHSVIDSLNRKNYQKLKEKAEEVEQHAGNLSETGENSIYSKAKESGDASKLYDEVEKLVSAYNGMLDKLRTDTSTLGRFYQSSLKAAATENKDALKGIGISIDKNGRMNVDKEKLKDADIDRVESVFGAEGTLTPKLYLIAEKVADSAEANLKSASSLYNAAGNSVDSLIRSYDAKR